VECKAQRFFGHMEGWDHQAYRGAGEVDALWAEHDCLRLLADRLVADGSVAPAELAEVDSAVRADVDHAVEEARAAKEPTVDQLLADVYVSY
jgi:pyruvate dehydrogenase E1 component alpha subunit